MDKATIKRLNGINRAFYAITATEFDQTRGTAWPGWIKLLSYIKPGKSLSVLDIGCGNGRFGRFLHDYLDASIDYHGTDNNPALLDYAREALTPLERMNSHFTAHDLIEQPLDDTLYDLVVIFGVVHHIPGANNRAQIIRQAAQRVRAGGYLVFACWRFYEYERFRDRITPWPDDITVEAHDYLLDWRRGEHALRYCHYVDDAEHESLVNASGLTHIATYRADGATEDLNCYSVLQAPQ